MEAIFPLSLGTRVNWLWTAVPVTAYLSSPLCQYLQCCQHITVQEFLCIFPVILDIIWTFKNNSVLIVAWRLMRYLHWTDHWYEVFFIFEYISCYCFLIIWFLTTLVAKSEVMNACMCTLQAVNLTTLSDWSELQIWCFLYIDTATHFHVLFMFSNMD